MVYLWKVLPNIFFSYKKCLLSKLSCLPPPHEALTSQQGSLHPGKDLGLKALTWFIDSISGKVSIGPLGAPRLHFSTKNVLQYGLGVRLGTCLARHQLLPSLLLRKVTVWCFLSKFLLKARHSAQACNLSTLKTEAGGWQSQGLYEWDSPSQKQINKKWLLHLTSSSQEQEQLCYLKIPILGREITSLRTQEMNG